MARTIVALGAAWLLAACAGTPEAAPEGAWQMAGALGEARELPRLAPLDDGRVLAIGGGSEMRASALRATEIFDPASGQWSRGPELTVARRDAEVVRLRDGRWLAIGGSDGPTRTGLASVEVLDSAATTWRSAGAMTAARIGHTATVLPDGRVLVVGGLERPGVVHRSAEVYDPARDAWTAVAEMSEPRSLHHARLLRDGTVLVIGGGSEASATHTTETFDPATLQWTRAGNLREPRWGFGSAVLEDGRVLVAGGRVPAKRGATLADDVMVILDGAEMYDPRSREWSPVARMNVPRSMGLPNVELVHLENGGYAFIGGRSYPAPYHGTRAAEYYDPRRNIWVPLPPLAVGRSYQANLRLRDGTVLVVGGRGQEFLPLTVTERYDARRRGT